MCRRGRRDHQFERLESETEKPGEAADSLRQAETETDLRVWKHSRQKTGRPCVGLNGTVVSFPQCEQLVRVSTRAKFWLETGVGPKLDDRLPLQVLQRLGSFLNCLSKKNNCSPAVKVKSTPQSMHFNTLSWNSIWRCSLLVQPFSHLLAERAPKALPTRPRRAGT